MENEAAQNCSLAQCFPASSAALSAPKQWPKVRPWCAAITDQLRRKQTKKIMSKQTDTFFPFSSSSSSSFFFFFFFFSFALFGPSRSILPAMSKKKDKSHTNLPFFRQAARQENGAALLQEFHQPSPSPAIRLCWCWPWFRSTAHQSLCWRQEPGLGQGWRWESV